MSTTLLYLLATITGTVTSFYQVITKKRVSGTLLCSFILISLFLFFSTCEQKGCQALFYVGLIGASVGWLISSTVILKLKPLLLFGLIILLISLSIIVIMKIFTILKLLKEFRWFMQKVYYQLGLCFYQ